MDTVVKATTAQVGLALLLHTKTRDDRIAAREARRRAARINSTWTKRADDALRRCVALGKTPEDAVRLVQLIRPGVGSPAVLVKRAYELELKWAEAVGFHNRPLYVSPERLMAKLGEMVTAQLQAHRVLRQCFASIADYIEVKGCPSMRSQELAGDLDDLIADAARKARAVHDAFFVICSDNAQVVRHHA